ncbi:MAG: methyltransferase family protein [Limisphaerales bacterium]
MNFLELRVPPPIVAFLVGVGMWLTPSLAGIVEAPFAVRVAIAVVCLLIGLTVAISGMVEFGRARTTINPVKAHTASSLVCSGIYRFTRNPMYVGLFFALLGWTVYLWNPLCLVFLLVYVLYINRFQIKPEERILLGLFGEPYAAYMQKVRRWI